MATYAFSSPYVPGTQDESAFAKNVLIPVFGSVDHADAPKALSCGVWFMRPTLLQPWTAKRVRLEARRLRRGSFPLRRKRHARRNASTGAPS
eukprot:2266068-Amphidinium_carterae.1